MESGFGQNLEGFLIKGNLSVIPSDLPIWQGDGSLEGSGTLYFNKIQEYNVGNGIDIAGIILRDNTVYVPYNKPSLNATSGSFVIDGGIGVNHTANSTCLTSGGALTIRGGASFGKNVHIGGILDVNANRIVNVDTPVDGKDAVNKDYVDLVAGDVSGNFTTSQVIIAETNGTKIRGYDSFTFDGSKLSISTPVIISNTEISTGLSSGGLVVYGGASIGGNSTLGGNLSLSGNSITNLATPVNVTDAANKQYVDDNKLQGNFTTGQLIIAASDGRDIRGFPELTFNGSTLTLFTTTNVTRSVGGAFVCYGGISISKDVFIGGQLDVNGNKIVNVDTPVQPSDVANKAYVDSRTFGTLLGSFGDKQVIIGTTDPNSLTGYNNFLYDGTRLSLGTGGSLVIYNTKNSSSLTGESSLVVYGGGNLRGDLFVGGHINAGGNTINRVADPLLPDDAATKKYVDDHKLQGNFTTGQLIIGDSNGDAIRGRDNLIFSYNTGNSSGTLILDELTDVSIKNTTNATGLGTGGTLTSLGGASFNKDVYIGGNFILDNTGASSIKTFGGAEISKTLTVGGIIDATDNFIKNVAYPVDQSDAANKQYVDDHKLSGNFTTGQLIIAQTNGNAIRGYNNLVFNTDGTHGSLVLNDVTTLNILNSSDATGYGTNGSFSTLGGGNFGKNVYIQGGLRVNLNRIQDVADPIEAQDAVTKKYADSLAQTISNNTSVLLNNNVVVAEDVPGFVFSSTTRAFIATAYIKFQGTSDKAALYTIYGYLDGNIWKITSVFIGDDININFYARTSNGTCFIQYTNGNTSGISSIQFTTISQINAIANTNQVHVSLLDNITSWTDISEISFAGIMNSAKLLIYVNNSSTTVGQFVLTSTIKTNGIWTYNSMYVDHIPDLNFRISSNGQLQYKNATSTIYECKIRVIEINAQSSNVLVANTIVPTNVPNNALVFSNTENIFQITLELSIPTYNKRALYELQGIYIDGSWKLNARFVGDLTGIKFLINTDFNKGTIQFINPNTVDAYIRFKKSTPVIFQSLPVSKGGTGVNYLEPYAVLRGNGVDPILATDDFIYKDNTLILGNGSSILLNNTTTAYSLTSGGTLTSQGGASFKKDVFIGGQLDVNLQRITNVHDPIQNYDAVNKLYVDSSINNFDLNNPNNLNPIDGIFYFDNGVNIPADIPNFYFDSTVKAFTATIYLNTNGICSFRVIYGYNCSTYWSLSSSFIGFNNGVQFSMRTASEIGYLQYTNPNLYGTTLIKYQINNIIKNTSSTQINAVLSGNVVAPNVISDINFDNTSVLSSKLIIYISSEIDNAFGIFFLGCVQTNSDWIINTYHVGNVTGVKFGIQKNNVTGKSYITYTNKNAIGDYTIRARQLDINNQQTSYTLLANKLIPTSIPLSNVNFSNLDYFELSIYVSIAQSGKNALYELQGLLCNGIWSINSRYIGDYTGIRFYMVPTVVGGGSVVWYLAYTNSANTDAVIKVMPDIPLTSLKPLSISRGGTGSSYLNPNAVLRGNGTGNIIATNDFIYDNNRLVLGNVSQIVLTNTAPAVNMSTGSLISYGGAAIGDDLLVGHKLVVNDIDVTPSVGDITKEQVFYAANQVLNSNVQGLIFNDNRIKSFTGVICVTVYTNVDEFDTLFQIRGLKKKNSNWILDYTSLGDSIGITFSIANNGQIQYTSTGLPGWMSTTMKYRATTTTI